MGAWGPAIFSDDTACDVRDDYRRLVGDGLSGPEATDALLAEWGTTPEDDDLCGPFWFGLAATQWKCGRLEPRVRDRALALLDAGAGLRGWDDSGQRRKRASALDQLRAQLTSPQPPERKIHRQFRSSCDWKVGEVVAYRLLSGNWCLFRVVTHHTDKGGVAPVCELLDWTGPAVPDAKRLKRLTVRAMPDPHGLHPRGVGYVGQFMIGQRSARDVPADRVHRTGFVGRPKQKAGGFTVFLWRTLDQQLAGVYGLA